jgi:hypothetical protein
VIGDVVYLRKAKVNFSSAKNLVEMMQGKATVKITTQEIMALTKITPKF